MATRKPEVIDLHKAIEAVAPIDGVSRKGDTTRIDYKADATDEQKSAAEAVLAEWDWNADVESELTDSERITALELLVENMHKELEALKKQETRNG